MVDQFITKFQKNKEQIETLVLAVVKQGEKLEQIDKKMVKKEDIIKLSSILEKLTL
ncbi:MAG: hypothetical protein AAB666_02465 [Patescibacteria group bacterium]